MTCKAAVVTILFGITHRTDILSVTDMPTYDMARRVAAANTADRAHLSGSLFSDTYVTTLHSPECECGAPADEQDYSEDDYLALTTDRI